MTTHQSTKPTQATPDLPTEPMNTTPIIPTIRVAKGPWNAGLQVLISGSKDGRMYVAEPITVRPLEPAELFEPQLELNDSEAQSLMDQLWQCGIRPTEGTGSAGAMAATQAHLADLRRLIFEDERLKP
jgi:hypothetical protein